MKALIWNFLERTYPWADDVVVFASMSAAFFLFGLLVG